MAKQGNSWYLSLLALAENFRNSHPPNIKLCIHCLSTVFNFKPPARIEARTHFQLGDILFSQTKNVSLARSHVEKAWNMSYTMHQSSDDIKFEAASLLATIYENQDQLDLAKPVLLKAIETSQQDPYWHCRLIFQLAQIHSIQRDFHSACQLLQIGSDYASNIGAQYAKILFLLSKGMLLLVLKSLGEVDRVLGLAGHLINCFVGTAMQRESLNVFFLVLQVCHFLMAGQVKTSKPALKQLQQSITTLIALPVDEEPLPAHSADRFHWLPKEHMCVLVYLLTVMHSLQNGYLHKAIKYTEKALTQIEKLKVLDTHPLLSSFQLLLLEHIIQCRLIMGDKTHAVQEISQSFQLCEHQPKLFTTHRAQIHTLLGLYAMSMNCMEQAEVQFNSALRLTTETELWLFVNMNLAIVYVRGNKQADLAALLQRIDPGHIQTTSHSLKASAYYVRGLQSFFRARYPDAKQYLREALQMANTEELNRLTACCLVLLGHTVLFMGNSQEATSLIMPAMQLASRIPDVHVQLWATALLKDLYRLCGDHQNEADCYQRHQGLSQALLKDHFQSSQQEAYSLIWWTDGPLPNR